MSEFEQLFQPLRFPGASPGDCRAYPSDITKLADRLGWSKRAPYQTVRAELGQPGCVGDIGFATGEILHVPRIDQQHFKSRVLRQVVERPPVGPGGRHYRTRDPLGDQMLTHARIWFAIELHVVTVSTVLRRPAPATRTRTMASFIEISSPAQRA